MVVDSPYALAWVLILVVLLFGLMGCKIRTVFLENLDVSLQFAKDLWDLLLGLVCRLEPTHAATIGEGTAEFTQWSLVLSDSASVLAFGEFGFVLVAGRHSN